MLRSFIAVLVATLVGLTVSKFTEGAGQLLLNAPAPIEGATVVMADGYGAVLVVAWAFAAFAAACCALFIGKRWAPLGGLAAATVFFSAAIALMSFSLHWMLWPISALATAGGGFAAIKLLRATAAYPEKHQKRAIFDN